MRHTEESEDLQTWESIAIKQIEHLSGLQANWDSYGAKAPDTESVWFAKKLVRLFARLETMERPSITLSPAGNIAMAWDSDKQELEVEVMPTGLMEYVLTETRTTKQPSTIYSILANLHWKEKYNESD
jgi:hypothetical protein